MDPLTMLAFGTQALGAVSGLASAGAQSKAANSANNLAMLQFLEQRRAAAAAEEEARAATQRSLEGSTDARGNSVRYVPGRGWVAAPSATTAQNLAASDLEEYQRNTGDAAQARALRAAITARQGREGNMADVTLAQRDLGSRSQDAIEAALLGSKAARALAANRAMQRGINMQALRTGSGGETALAELGRSGMEDVRTAIADARLEGAPQFIAERAAREGANNTSYNMFASRAANPMANEFRPTNTNEITAALEGARGAGNAGAQTLVQAIANRSRITAPQLPYAEDKTPTAIAGFGSALMGAGNLYNAYQKRNAGGSSTFGDPVMQQAYLMRGGPI